MAAANSPCSARSAACSSDELAPVAIFYGSQRAWYGILEITQFLSDQAADLFAELQNETSSITLQIWACICPELQPIAGQLRLQLRLPSSV